MAKDVPSCTGGVSASADSKVIRFTYDQAAKSITLDKTVELPKEGIADVAVRLDGRIFATAGWDGKIRIFSYGKAKPLALLHVRSICCPILSYLVGN